MTKVQQAVEDLLSVIRQTEEYTEYRCQLEKLKMQPELHRQVDAFRSENFELQSLTPEDQLLQKTEQFEEKCEEILTMMMAECCKSFERLPLIWHVSILRNILYSGVWCRYKMIKQKRESENEKSL